MSNIPGKESKSQIAYRLESEAKAASEALKLSKEKAERDNRLLGRDAHSSSQSASKSIIKSTISSDMSEATQLAAAKEEIEASQKLIAQYKQMEIAYYANIETTKAVKADKDSRQLES